MQIHTQTMNPDSKINNTQHISSHIVYVLLHFVMTEQYALYSGAECVKKHVQAYL